MCECERGLLSLDTAVPFSLTELYGLLQLIVSVLQPTTALFGSAEALLSSLVPVLSEKALIQTQLVASL